MAFHLKGIMSPHYDKDAAALYGNNQDCKFDVVDEATMEVEDFNVEYNYDFLTVDEEKFSGSKDPQGVKPANNITWSADYSVTKVGWKICPRQTPDTSPLKKTSKGCDCKAQWSYQGTPAAFCGNPDSDPAGAWCAVTDSGCQGSWWGYC